MGERRSREWLAGGSRLGVGTLPRAGAWGKEMLRGEGSTRSGRGVGRDRGSVVGKTLLSDPLMERSWFCRQSPSRRAENGCFSLFARRNVIECKVFGVAMRLQEARATSNSLLRGPLSIMYNVKLHKPVSLHAVFFSFCCPILHSAISILLPISGTC